MKVLTYFASLVIAAVLMYVFYLWLYAMAPGTEALAVTGTADGLKARGSTTYALPGFYVNLPKHGTTYAGRPYATGVAADYSAVQYTPVGAVLTDGAGKVLYETAPVTVEHKFWRAEFPVPVPPGTYLMKVRNGDEVIGPFPVTVK